MKLTNKQQLLIAERISEDFAHWVKKEMFYQVDTMMDSDELSWDYSVTDTDLQIVTALVEEMVNSVPVE